MGDISTLIVGPSGTGKELVARAIGLARYVPFSSKKGDFEEDFVNSFHPLSLPALASTLIESELFGHCRGAFTGAVADRCGYLELCEACGTVFLDEIGELEHIVQVKLLRVLQARTFQRLGDTQLRRFRGKIIAATNLDLAAEISTGRFREDLYYRLCSDIIVTPSLREQLADSPGDLLPLVRFIAQQIAPEEAEPIANEVVGWITTHLDSDYVWPGNFRELEQCVKNVLVRGEYTPASHARQETREALTKALLEGTLTADEAISLYCRLVYEKTGSYVAAARQLKLDRRTVRARLGLPPAEGNDPGHLAATDGGAAGS
jgi:transcriptional regulator with GAF, ATPase, and Fis domain